MITNEKTSNDTGIRERDIHDFLDYICNDDEIVLIKDNYEKFDKEYQKFIRRYDDEHETKLINIINNYTNLNESKWHHEPYTILSYTIKEYYKDDIDNYVSLKEREKELRDKINNNEIFDEKEYEYRIRESEFISLSESVENYKPKTVGSVIEELRNYKKVFIGCILTLILYIAIFYFLENDIKALSIICFFVWIFVKPSLISAMSNEIDISFPLTLLLIFIFIWELILGELVGMALGFANNILYMCNMQIISSIILNCIVLPIGLIFEVKSKINARKLENINSNKINEANKKKLKELENKYNKAEKELDDYIKPIDDELDSCRKKLKKIENRDIDLDELREHLHTMLNDMHNLLCIKQAEVVNKWNDFAEFRKKHYIRELEDFLNDQKVMDRINRLTDNNSKINSVKINSKNYIEYGKSSDYTEYIYDKIDEYDSKLEDN